MTTTCYFCSAQATSVEHVPPRCLFPEKKDLDPGMDLRKELITVPSCEEHNSKQSRDDEYLLYVLLFNIPNNDTAKNHFRTKLTRAIQRNPKMASMLSKVKVPVSVLDNETGEVSHTYAFKIDRERLIAAIEKIGRALYFHHNQVQWRGEIQVIPNFLLALEHPEAKFLNVPLEQMTEYTQVLMNEAKASTIGSNPEVFTYQVTKGENHFDTVMLLRFYGGSFVTLLFKHLPAETTSSVSQ